MKFNTVLLNEICVSTGCTHLMKNVKKITRDTQIIFICKCGVENSRNFRQFFRTGGHCKSCTEKQRKERCDFACVTKFGTAHPQTLPEIDRKRKDTNLERYGKENPSQLPDYIGKVQKTSLERFGFTTAMLNPDIYKKYQDTLVSLYGHKVPVHNSEIFEKCVKNGYKSKYYVLKSGETIRLQGYEPFALDILLCDHEESDILYKRTDVPEIWYTKYEKNYIARYYPDFFIKSTNTIIEVKSVYIFEKDRVNNIRKIFSCLAQGYNMFIWFFDNKGKLLQIL